MGAHERFNLWWDAFEANTRIALREMREEVEFWDVTLVPGYGKQIKSNKVILAGGSSFFHQILRENPHPHPLIYLKDVRYNQLLSVLDFLYTGEANIAQEDINQFMDIAEDLKIKGLTPSDKQTKSLPKPVAPLQNQVSIEEKAPDQNKAYPSSVIRAPQGQVAAQEQVSSKSFTSPNSTGEDVPLKTISSYSFVPALDQGRVPADECPSSPRKAPLCIMTPHSSNTFAKTNSEDDTCHVKVEVGNAEDYVSYGMNDEREQYIKSVSERGLHNNKQNIQQNEEYQNEGREQDQNDQGISTWKKLKKELVSNNDTVPTKAVDSIFRNEEVIHAWYECNQENYGWILAEEKDNYIQLHEKNNSMRSCGDKCDIVVTEAANSDFNNDQSTHGWYEQVKDKEDDKMTHEVEQGIDNEALSSGDKDFQCTKSHTGEKPLKCMDGSKSFSTGGAFYKHKSIHTDKKRHQCLVCQKSFSRRDTLKAHKMVHTGERPYQCSHCFKGCRTSSDMNSHMKIHTGEKPHKCLVCYKSFSRLYNLNKHKMIHTGERPYQCSQCSKRFITSSELNRHLKSHTGERPYQCLQCSKSFIRLSHFNQHKKKKNKCSSYL